MNSDLRNFDWWLFLGMLALETAAMVACIAMAQRWIRSAVWRRSLWQVSFLAIAALVLAETTGLGRAPFLALRSLFLKPPVTLTSNPQSQVGQGSGQAFDKVGRGSRQAFDKVGRGSRRALEKVEGSSRRALEFPRAMVTESLHAAASVPSDHGPLGVPASAGGERRPAKTGTTNPALAETIHREPELGTTAPDPITDQGVFLKRSWLGPWLGWIWLAGTSLALGWFVLGRISLVFLPRRWPPVRDTKVIESVRRLSGWLGIRRPVRLLESPRLECPMAFGLWRSTVVLPEDFSRHFAVASQEVMLAHELAHVAARDPLWHGLADGVCALIWWQPAIWWARYQWRQASEMAADEASLLVVGGPPTLAECLVRLGAQISLPKPLAWLGVEGQGFRSGLGRRVERLVRLEAPMWRAPDRIRLILLRTAGPLLLASLALFGTAWFSPPTLTQGKINMKSLQSTWNHSLAAMLLMAAVPTGAEPASPSTGVAEAPPPSALPSPTPAPGAVKTNLYLKGWTPEMMRRYGLKPESVVIEDPAPPTQPATVPVAAPQAGQSAPANLGPGRGMNAEMRRRYGLPPESPAAASQPPAAVGPVTSGQQARATIAAKLEQIILAELKWPETISLREVVKSLDEEVRSRDPDKRGLNFVIYRGPRTSPSIDPTTGQPLTVEPGSIGDANLRLDLPLRNMRLKDVLEVITKVADQPLKYEIKEFGVVFLPKEAVEDQPEPDAVAAADAAQFRMNDALRQRYGLSVAGPATTPTPAPDPRKQALSQQLDQIILDQVGFNGVPFGEVIRYLDEQARKRGGNEINFILSQGGSSPGARGGMGSGAGGQTKPAGPNRADGLKLLEQQLAEQEHLTQDYQQHLIRMREELQISDAAAESGQTDNPETLRQLESERLRTASELNQVKSLLDELKKLNRSALRKALPTAVPDAHLLDLLARYDQTEADLATQKQEFGDSHPKVVHSRVLLEKINGQIEAKMDGILMGLQTKANSLQAMNETAAKQLEVARRQDLENAKKFGPYLAAKRKLEEQKKIAEAFRLRYIQEKVEYALRPGEDVPSGGAAATEPFDLKNVLIRLDPPLRHVTLRQAMEAIVKVADVPIRFTIEDYAVVFSAANNTP